MKLKLALLTLLALAFVNSSMAQSTVEYKKAFGGYKFISDGQTLTVNQLIQKYSDNPEAYALITDAKSSYTLGVVLGSIGGFMIGYPLGTALGGGDPNWTLAAIGVGVLAVSIPINQTFYKKAIKATDIYNNGLDEEQVSMSLNLGLNKNGFGLTVLF